MSSEWNYYLWIGENDFLKLHRFHVFLGSRLCDCWRSRKTAFLDLWSCYWCSWYFTRCMFLLSLAYLFLFFYVFLPYVWFDHLGWSNRLFMQEGLAMIDDGHRDRKRRYWFPCVSSNSTPVADTWKQRFSNQLNFMSVTPYSKDKEQNCHMCTICYNGFRKDLLLSIVNVVSTKIANLN